MIVTGMIEPTHSNSAVNTISEAEFVKLCDGIYADREQLYEFNPGAGRRDALLWMLAGCLLSWLSLPASFEPEPDGQQSADPYGHAILELLRGRTEPPFDPRPHLAALMEKIESEAANRPTPGDSFDTVGGSELR